MAKHLLVLGKTGYLTKHIRDYKQMIIGLMFAHLEFCGRKQSRGHAAADIHSQLINSLLNQHIILQQGRNINTKLVEEISSDLYLLKTFITRAPLTIYRPECLSQEIVYFIFCPTIRFKNYELLIPTSKRPKKLVFQNHTPKCSKIMFRSFVVVKLGMVTLERKVSPNN